MIRHTLRPLARRVSPVALSLTFASTAALAACDDGPPGEADAAGEGGDPVSAATAHDVGSDEHRVDELPTHALHEKREAAEVMPDAAAAFEEIVELVERKYVDADVDRDALYTAALRGMMDALIQLPDAEINALLSPRELHELHLGTAGQLVGIGVAIEQVADVVVVRRVLPGSPAADSDIRPGDRILGVDGDRLTGQTLVQVVDAIRGEPGTEVSLFVQRDTEEWNETLTRGTIEMVSVEHEVLDDGVGLVRIRSFAENTAEDFDAALAALDAEEVERLVLDLRGCPGGLLDAALEVASRLLADGERIVSMTGRDGQTRHVDASGKHPWGDRPVVVLVGPKTASGAEILAAALAHHGRAALVGAPTRGKGTVESVHKLDNGWAVKLSIERFASPDGQLRHGHPVEPDFLVTEHGQGDDDPQLRAALRLLAR